MDDNPSMITLDLTAGDGDLVHRATLPKASLCTSATYFASMLAGGFREALPDVQCGAVRIEVPPLAGADAARLARFCNLLGGIAQPAPADVAFADALLYVGALEIAQACSNAVTAVLDLWGQRPCCTTVAVPAGAEAHVPDPIDPLALSELAKTALLAYAVRLRAEACDAPLDSNILPRPRRLVFDAQRFWDRACGPARDCNGDGDEPPCRASGAQNPPMPAPGVARPLLPRPGRGTDRDCAHASDQYQ
ncbi:hypothetical protein TW95_gp1623 [Pandoravirus inopinatum]|uniref:Uncharacterized protein n=1 Tax=Pandoravirus inopinatum TaxID=1605721 RepID=A0A0B5JEW9_9VIRU|nr:hypothetical protein TW95_gp1623 [Pandoravirus inopinatum]AJF98357.1 hypothetical protein [Pandoravirus inopinatum]